MVSFFAGITAVFMKWGMFFSHLKLMAAYATGNLHVVAHHLVYKHVYAVARPALHWAPL